MTDDQDKPRGHRELEALVRAHIRPVLEMLSKEHGVITVGVFAFEFSDVSSVIANMTPSDAAASLSAALFSYQHARRDDETAH